MRVWLVTLSLVMGVFFTGQAQAQSRGAIQQWKYTCSQLKTYLAQQQSIWVSNRIFRGLRSNITVRGRRPVCQGAARSRRDRICRNVTGSVTAKDGRCRLGVECFCRAPQRDDND